MPFTVRKARVDDAPGIARVHVASWRTTYRDLLKAEVLASLSYERRAEGWKRTLADPGSASFLYVTEDENGRIVGFVAAGSCQAEETEADGEIYAICLLEEVQGQGLGRRLMQAAMEELGRRGFRS